MVSIQDELWRCAQYFVAKDGLLHSRKYKFQTTMWMKDADVFSRLKPYFYRKKAQKNHKNQKKQLRQLNLFDFLIFSSNLPGVRACDEHFDEFVNACVVFVDVLKKEQLEKLTAILKPYSLLKKLFVCSNNVTAASLVSLKKVYSVEVFSPVLCLLRPEKHIGQPKMRLASRAEVNELIGEQEESSLELCKLSQHDPKVKFNGWTVGSIIHIERPTQDGLQEEFRIVSGDV